MHASQNTVYRHAGTAVDFLINGAMRKLENEIDSNAPTDKLLAGLVARIHAECDDWAESILDIAPNEISVGLNCARNPYNIATAIIDLLVELNGLEGLAKDGPSMTRINAAVTMIRARNAQDESTFSATTPPAPMAVATANVPAPYGLIAVFPFHPDTPESEVITMAKACGLQLVSYNADGIATVVGTQAQIAALAADLGYDAQSVRTVA